MRFFSNKLTLIITVASLLSPIFFQTDTAYAITDAEIVDVHTQVSQIEAKIKELDEAMTQSDVSIGKFNSQIKALETKIKEQEIKIKEGLVAVKKFESQKDNLKPLLAEKGATWSDQKRLTVNDSTPPEKEEIHFSEEAKFPMIQEQIKVTTQQKKLLAAELVQKKLELKRANLKKEYVVLEAAATKPDSGIATEQIEAVKNSYQQQNVLWDKRATQISQDIAVFSQSESTELPSIQFGFEAPVKDPISSTFGLRSGYDTNGFHKGLDFASAIGTEIHPVMAGEVVVAQEDGPMYEGYGNVVVIRHDNGTWTLYAHQSELLVKVGDRVETKTVIGKVGQTGQSDGPHLHLEVRTSPEGGVGHVVDPAPLIDNLNLGQEG
ncbi:MAG: peptidoglycan DD-metalloendopeptidase family protein [Carnobacterium sp.]|uniref:peptidoglycan DD-metalloendopeptidase family protein n=1 Tax=Carnobacterium sp. TaxID=48221 RepID=UPI0028E884B7|nr:peptidoglycan DD-metalloendopeptidase family protein [Carnobacterium maltaromaticum]